MGVNLRAPTTLAALALLIALSLAALGLAPLVVKAAGGEIRVVETRQQVNYPSGVELSITIESEAALSEIRVYYRAAGSRQWGYAYADFEPGARIVATQSVPVSGSTYIAPGADVEYYFEIRDVEGNVVRTDRAVVEYLDHRFNWRRINVGPLELVYHDISDSRIEEAAQALYEDLARVQQLLHLEQPQEFKGVIYNSYADANAAFPVQSQTTTDHGTFAGYAFSEQRVFVGQGLDRRIIVHESTHLMFRNALGNRNVEVPAWLNEGFATYMEPDVRVRGSNELYERTPHLKAMKGLSGTPETIPLFYQKSVSVVAHLIEEYGEDRFHLLLGEIAKGRPIDTALINVYGFDDHGLDNSWAGLPIPDLGPLSTVPAASEKRSPATAESGGPRKSPTGTANERTTGQGQAGPASPPATPASAASSDSRPISVPAAQTTTAPQQQTQGRPPGSRQRDDPSPFIFFDAWILAGVALLAVAVVSARFIYNRLRRQDDAAGDAGDSWLDDYIDDD